MNLFSATNNNLFELGLLMMLLCVCYNVHRLILIVRCSRVANLCMLNFNVIPLNV